MKLSYLKMFLLSLLVISLVACGGKKEEAQPETTPQEELAKPAEETVEATPEVVDTTAQEPKKVEEVKEEVKKEEPKKAPASGDYSTQPMNAFVVALNDVAAGKDGKVSKSEAQSLLTRNQLLAVKNEDNGNVYLVYHSNGTYAGKDLANMADVKIGILGKAKKVKGVNVIMADKIRPIR